MIPLLVVSAVALVATYVYGPWRLFKRCCAKMAALCMAGAHWCGLQEDAQVARRGQYERYRQAALLEVYER